ncbi:hypothetical protein AM1BK_06130 [Neobacillus kokaensis]|uniref:Transposase IS4-like domain-containing protein n=1 Tax=Neobacillus kokaensis TaxID=2759023 RepID=A0ABQ3MWL8_9BACI|nr:hypothetical protein AM1BK_06130 [Neobacillus kokaensis]
MNQFHITLQLVGIANIVFKGTNIFQEISNEIVLPAMNHKMVGCRVLFIDSTHLKANANKHKFTKEEVEVKTREYKKKFATHLARLEKVCCNSLC